MQTTTAALDLVDIFNDIVDVIDHRRYNVPKVNETVKRTLGICAT
jgi:hypothetical protein